MLSIVIQTIPHECQRYDTVGDWYQRDDTLYINISNMNNWRKEAGIAIHELSEFLLCKDKGITEADVDQFDLAFEANRAIGDYSEPGDNSLAPYKQQHFTATTIERILVQALGVDWDDYEKTINDF